MPGDYSLYYADGDNVDGPVKHPLASSSAFPLDSQPLLPGLPDDVSLLILLRLPPSVLFHVCLSWRRLIYTPSFPSFLYLYALSKSYHLHAFDPVSSTWLKLPRPPRISTRRIVTRHPCIESLYLTIQSVTVSGNIVLLAATSNCRSPAFPQPLIFNPAEQTWQYGPKMNLPRRWCAGGACSGELYAAGGAGMLSSEAWGDIWADMRYTTRAVEKLNFVDLRKIDWMQWNRGWKRLRDFESDSACIVPVGAVGWRGKLLVADCRMMKASVYDVKSDTWWEMTAGMIKGWRGPTASMDEETLYSVDKAEGVLRRYNEMGDCWEDILCIPELRGAEQITAGGGRVCVVQSGGGGIMVVDVLTSPAKFWIMDSPEGSKTLALHILPRIC